MNQRVKQFRLKRLFRDAEKIYLNKEIRTNLASTFLKTKSVVTYLLQHKTRLFYRCVVRCELP